MEGPKRNLLIALGVVVLVGTGLFVYVGSREFGPQPTLGGFMGERPPVTFSGSGTAKTRTPSLIGPYTVTWTAVADSDAGCHLDARLRSRGLGELLVSEVIEDAAPHTGQTKVDTHFDGGFYIDAISSCSWEFRFDPS